MAKRRLTQRQAQRIRMIQERRLQRAKKQQEKREAAIDDTLLGAEQTGLVVAQHGVNLTVEDGRGQPHFCLARQNLGPIVCGDQVVWQMLGGAGEGVVVALMPRHTILARPDARGHMRPAAANIDCIMVMVAAAQPELSEDLVNRYLVAAEFLQIPPVIVVNKIDLLDAAQRLALDQRLASYPAIGYRLLPLSTKTGVGIEAVVDRLRNRTSVLVGQSGVGKSSLAKVLLPQRDIRIRPLGPHQRFGRHTTSTAVLYRLPQGGALIDSPGVRQFRLGNIAPTDLERGFTEFGRYLGRCRFNDCRHDREPDCAVRAAAAAGWISAGRLESYLRLRAALEEAGKR